MEDQRPSWEEAKKDKKEKTSLPNPVGGEGLLAYLARMQAEEAERHKEESEDDDEDSEKGKKKSRLRRILSRIFGSVAPVEEQKPPADLQTTINTETQSIPEEHRTHERPVEVPAAAVNEIEETQAEVAKDPVTMERTEARATEPIPVVSAEMPTENKLAEETAKMTPSETVPPIEEVPSPEQFGDRVLPSAAILYERSAERPQPPVRKEVIIDRRSSWAPALIVDQLARHRDRKLKREDRRIDREVQQLKKESPMGEEKANARLEQFAVNTSNQFETVQTQHQQLERRLEPIEPVIEKIRFNPEKEPGKAERVIERRPETMPLPEITPEVAPVVVLQEVEAAAERNVPIEGAYEKRHEVKDESAQSQQLGAASVGKVLADLHQQTTTQHTAFSKVFQDQAKQAAQTPAISYKQAAQSGFWAGIVIVAILIMIAIAG